MNSNVTPPDLVLRAAERLATERQNTAEHLRPVNDISRHPAANAPKPDQEFGQKVTISPAVLAANGIYLQSADTESALTLEEFRSIRRQVLSNISRSTQTLGGSANRTVLVTSARPGDGKTFTSINLALSLAYSGEHHVLLMDADARRRSMIAYLGIKAQLGWADVLRRSDLSLSDVLLGTNVPNLSVLPSGMPGDDLSDLVSSRKMSGLLTELNNRDSKVITVIDTMPCLASNEPEILAEWAGQTLFVVAANETSREEVQASLSHLAGAPIVSLVLNKGEPLMAEQFSKYGYYNYERK